MKLALAEYVTLEPVGAGPAFFEQLKERTQVLIDALDTHLVWEGPGWPDAPFTTLGTYLPQTLQAYVANIQNETPWDWFAHTIVSDWNLSMRCTYWKTALTVSAYAPWEASTMSVTDADVSDFTLQPVDPGPIAGIICLNAGAQITGYTALEREQGIAADFTDGQAHVEATLPGAIGHLRLPYWMTGLIVAYNAINSPTTAFTGQPGVSLPMSGSEALGDLGPVPLTILDEMKAGLEIFCKQAFCMQYRDLTQISLTCRLMLNTLTGIDGYITPGYVCAFDADPAAAAEAGLSSDLEGGTLVKFFVTTVVHTVDCVGKRASTDIQGQYVHRGQGPNLDAINAGVAPNYLYTTA